MRLQEHKDSTNRFGIPLAEAYKAQPFVAEEFVDWSERAVEAERRRALADAESKAGGKDKLPEGWADGRNYFARLPDPSELREEPRAH